MKHNDNMEIEDYDANDMVVVSKGHLGGLLSNMKEVGMLQEKMDNLIADASRPGFWSKWKFKDAKTTANKLARAFRRLEAGVGYIHDAKTVSSNVAGLNKVA